MNCGNNENKKEKLSLFTRIKKHIETGRDEYIKNTSYKRFLYNIDNTLNCFYYLFMFIFLLFGVMLFSFGMHLKNYNSSLVLASAKSINEISNYDTITDLTGTSWILNDDCIYGIPFTYSINYDIVQSGVTKSQASFVSDGVTFKPDLHSEPVVIYYLQGTNSTGSAPDVTNVLGIRYIDNTTWYIDNATILITGGADATNTSLISWLQNNATQIQTGPTQLTTPTLQSALDVQTGVDLYWSYDSSISTPHTFEIFRNGVQYGSTSSSFFNTKVDGVYKVRQMSDDNAFTDSEFSNEITITGLTHFNLTLGNGISSVTTCSTNGTTLNTTFSYSSFYLLLDSNFNTQLYPIIDFRIYNTDDNTLNGNLLETGYVFNSVNDLTTDCDIQYFSNLSSYQGLSFRLLELNTNSVNISVVSHSGKLISDKTFIYDKQLSNYDLSIGDYLLKDKSFISNENSYDNIFVNNYNYLVYDNDTTIIDDTTYFLSNLTGQYISNSTYNYMLVSVSSDYIQGSLTLHYLPSDDIFFDFYRLATQSDFDNINALNNQLVNLNDNYTFLSLFGSIIDAHFNTIKSLINFNFFGINLWSIFTLFLTLTLTFIVFKFLRGGKKE